MMEPIQIGAMSVEAKRELLRSLLVLREGSSTGVYPLTPAQQALWFVYQLAPESPGYNFLFAARLPADTDLDALERAFASLVDRHVALRTRFFLRDGKPVQMVEPALVLTIPRVDASAWPWDELQAHLRRRADVPFDLERGPAFRVEYHLRRDETVLLLAFHHLVADLWSMDVLIEELQRFYAAEVAGRPAALPPVPGDFVDYLRHQITALHGPRGQEAWDYWRTELAGELPVLELPTDHPRPPVQTSRYGIHTWPLSTDAVTHLRRLAAQEGTTLAPCVLAAFELLLLRYSGQPEVLIGVTTADRGRPEWERMVGYFLNQVVVRGRADGERTFRELIGQAREKLYRALDHQDVPFAELVRRLAPRRDPSRPAVFQTMFIWDRPRTLPFPRATDLTRPPQGRPGTLTLDPLLLEQRGDSFDLTFIVFEDDQHLTARLSWNLDLFDEATIVRMASHLETLLAGLAASPDAPVAEVSMLGAGERRHLLELGRPPEIPLPGECFLCRFERVAGQTPDAIAAEYEGRPCSYGELNRRANRLARWLIGRGVRPGDLVALHLPRGTEVVVAQLAAWKARAAWLFLDPAYPPARLTGMVEDAGPALVLSAPEVPAIEGGGSPVFSITEVERGLANEDASNLGLPASLEDRAYVIYTSGSTGRPKGTLLLQRGVNLLCESMVRGFELRPGDRILQFASPSFDSSVWEVVMTLGAGATLVLAPQSSLIPGPGLATLLRERRVSVMTMPPSILAALPCDPLPDLRVLIVAGEACPAELVTRWSPGRRFYNSYGPTEATVGATIGECRPDGRPPSIGRPIARTTMVVCGADLQLVPVGVPGELYLGGPGLAVGYLNQPGLTAERFIPDPFHDEPGGALYRTGDLVRWRPDGEMDFLGRVDHQIKLRGHRIELEEIQEVLRRHPAVADAAVVVRDDGKGPALAAYAVPRQPGGLPLDALRAHLRGALPVYMLPATITPLERMPLTVNGKIDRPALLRVAPRAPASSRPEPPRTATERALADVWSRVLGVESVGVNDNFFDMGGASVQTVEVVSLAGEVGLKLTPEQLFRHQTIAELASAISGSVEGAGRSTGNGRHKVSSRAPAPAARPSEVPPLGPQSTPGALVESLGVYLPERSVSTEEVLRGCRVPLDFPLERFTGIRSRRTAGDGVFSIDLAGRALAECLARSRHRPADVDLIVCCNISRYDGPMFRFTLEPTTAVRLKRQFGLVNALAFDLTNACAGTFTAVSLVDALLRAGLVRRALVVSGEYITHLTRTAQLEIRDFMDPRMACLTLGDAGVALLLERAPTPEVGFRDLDLFTIGKYHELCVARATTGPHGGAIMFADPVKSSVITTHLAVRHCLELLERNDWAPDTIRQLIMHQTSERTLDGAVREINRVVGRPVVGPSNTVYNLAQRGNSATTTHFLAVWENIQAGRIHPGDRAVFAVSGSGISVGSALYTFDDLPDRLRGPAPVRQPNGHHAEGERTQVFRFSRPVRFESIGDPAAPGTSAEMLRAAGEDCLARSSRPRGEIDLILHTGVYRTDFLSEPALAAIAAGELGINHDDEQPGDRRTFAFDLLGGGTGTLTACFTAAGFMQAGRYTRTLVLASEVENNADAWPEHPLGLAQTATAFVLEPGGDGGFVAFGFRAFPEHLDARASWTGPHDFKPAVFHQNAGHLDDLYLECIEEAVGEFLRGVGVTLDEVDVVLPPWRSPAFTRAVAERLGVPAQRAALMPGGEADLFTSSLACVFADARRRGLLSPGKLALVIEVGSGVQVACALYRGA